MPASQRALPITWPALATSSAASSSRWASTAAAKRRSRRARSPGATARQALEGGRGARDGGVGLRCAQPLDLGDDLAGGGVADVHARDLCRWRHRASPHRRAGTSARPRRYSARPCPPPPPDASTVQFNLAKAFDTLVETLAERECIVWRDRRLTYAQLAERSRRLASYLHGRGLGVRRERAAAGGLGVGPGPRRPGPLQRQRVPRGDAGLVPGPRSAPFNVNYRYVGEELRYLLNDARPRAMILHSSLAPTLRRGAAHAGRRLPTCCSRSTTSRATPSSPGRRGTRRRWPHRRPTGPPVDPSPDDLYILYTGGTTGMPKGVLWRQHDIFMAAMGGRKVGTWEIVTSYEGITERLDRQHAAPAPAPAAAHARGGAVGRLHADGPGGDARLPRRHPPAWTPTTCGAPSSARRPTS